MPRKHSKHPSHPPSERSGAAGPSSKPRSRPGHDPSLAPTLPPPRSGLPTSPVDLSEFAREATGPDVGAISTRESELDVSQVPHVVLSRERLQRLKLDQVSKQLLKLVDGKATAEEVIARAAVPEDEAAVALYELQASGVIVLR
jgi:hypothetical protein